MRREHSRARGAKGLRYPLADDRVQLSPVSAPSTATAACRRSTAPAPTPLRNLLERMKRGIADIWAHRSRIRAAERHIPEAAPRELLRDGHESPGEIPPGLGAAAVPRAEAALHLPLAANQFGEYKRYR